MECPRLRCEVDSWKDCHVTSISILYRRFLSSVALLRTSLEFGLVGWGILILHRKKAQRGTPTSVTVYRGAGVCDLAGMRARTASTSVDSW